MNEQETCVCGSVIQSRRSFTVTWQYQQGESYYVTECAMCGAVRYFNADTGTQVTREEVLP